MNSVYLDMQQLKRYVDSVYADGLSKFHVSLVEAHVLVVLHECGAMRATDLARAVMYSQTSFTPVLDHLQEMNLIRRGENAADRRSVFISLTEEGATLAPLLANVLDGADLIVKDAFSTKRHVAHEFVEKYAKVPY